MQISFIIPHKGRLEMLRQTVQSVLALDYDQTQIEIIVVSQNEQLITADITSDVPANLSVYLQPENLTISALRNFGRAHAKGEYLAFLDADIELAPNWLNAMFGLFNDNQARKLVSAFQRNADNAPELEQVRTEQINAGVDRDVVFLPGRNLFLHKDTFDAVGGFPEHLATCEDYYFTDQVSRLGSVHYSSRSSYVHLGEDKAWLPMFKKEIWRGQSNLKSLEGRRIPLREYPSLLLPIWIFIALTALLAAVIAGAGNVVMWSFIAIMLPIMAYSHRLYNLSQGRLNYLLIANFYLVYFIARALGTVIGVVKSIGVRSAS